MSRFGQYCRDRGLEQLLSANVERIKVHGELLRERTRQAELETRRTLLTACVAATSQSGTMSADTKKTCDRAIGDAGTTVTLVHDVVSQ